MSSDEVEIQVETFKSDSIQEIDLEPSYDELISQDINSMESRLNVPQSVKKCCRTNVFHLISQAGWEGIKNNGNLITCNKRYLVYLVQSQKSGLLVAKIKSRGMRSNSSAIYNEADSDLVSMQFLSPNEDVLSLVDRKGTVYMVKIEKNLNDSSSLQLSKLCQIDIPQDGECACFRGAVYNISWLPWKYKLNFENKLIPVRSDTLLFALYGSNGNCVIHRIMVPLDKVQQTFEKHSLDHLVERAFVANMHESAITSLYFSPDSAYISTSGEDGKFKLWEFDFETKTQIHVYNDLKPQCEHIPFDNSDPIVMHHWCDTRMLSAQDQISFWPIVVLVSSNNVIKLYNTLDFSLVQTISLSSSLICAQSSDDSARLMVKPLAQSFGTQLLLATNLNYILIFNISMQVSPDLSKSTDSTTCNNKWTFICPFISKVYTMPIQMDVLDFVVYPEFYINKNLVGDGGFRCRGRKLLNMFALSKKNLYTLEFFLQSVEEKRQHDQASSYFGNSSSNFNYFKHSLDSSNNGSLGFHGPSFDKLSSLSNCNTTFETYSFIDETIKSTSNSETNKPKAMDNQKSCSTADKTASNSDNDDNIYGPFEEDSSTRTLKIYMECVAGDTNLFNPETHSLPLKEANNPPDPNVSYSHWTEDAAYRLSPNTIQAFLEFEKENIPFGMDFPPCTSPNLAAEHNACPDGAENSTTEKERNTDDGDDGGTNSSSKASTLQCIETMIEQRFTSFEILLESSMKRLDSKLDFLETSAKIMEMREPKKDRQATLLKKLDSLENSMKAVKSNQNKLAENVSYHVVSSIEETLKDLMTSLVTELGTTVFKKMEQLCQQMFDDVDKCFAAGTQEYLSNLQDFLDSFEKNVRSEAIDSPSLSDKMEKVHSNLDRLSKTICSLELKTKELFTRNVEEMKNEITNDIVTNIKSLNETQTQTLAELYEKRPYNFDSPNPTPQSQPPANARLLKELDPMTKASYFMNRGQLVHAMKVTLSHHLKALCLKMVARYEPCRLIRDPETSLSIPELYKLLYFCSEDLTIDQTSKISYIQEILLIFDVAELRHDVGFIESIQHLMASFEAHRACFDKSNSKIVRMLSLICKRYLV